MSNVHSHATGQYTCIIHSAFSIQSQILVHEHWLVKVTKAQDALIYSHPCFHISIHGPWRCNNRSNIWNLFNILNKSTFHCNWHLVTVCCFPPYNHLLPFGDADCQTKLGTPKLGTSCLIILDYTLSASLCGGEESFIISKQALGDLPLFSISGVLSEQLLVHLILQLDTHSDPSCSSTLVVQHSVSRQVYRLNSTGAIQPQTILHTDLFQELSLYTRFASMPEWNEQIRWTVFSGTPSFLKANHITSLDTES